MHGLTVRWSLADAPDGVEKALADYVADTSHERFTGKPEFVVTLKCVDHAGSNAADPDGTSKSAFCICAQGEHRFRTTPIRDFR